MKNIRKFETTAEMESAVLENVSISYNVETGGMLSMPLQSSGVDYSTMYTTLEALEDGAFSFAKTGTGDDIQYSKDNGSTWTSLASGEIVSVVTGDKVMWKSTITPGGFGVGCFFSSNKFNVSGNIMSLLYGDNFKEQTSLESKDYVFGGLFVENYELIDASNLILPATTLAKACYAKMFQSCYGLTTPPELPATTLADNCYAYMFQDCTSLTTPPELPATTLADGCYTNMFNGCTSLNHITMLATDVSAHNCFSFWVYNVASTGTFVKHPDMESLPTGADGIPEGWTVEDYQG